MWTRTFLKVGDESIALIPSLVIFSGYAHKEGEFEFSSCLGFCQIAIMGWWEDSDSEHGAGEGGVGQSSKVLPGQV